MAYGTALQADGRCSGTSCPHTGKMAVWQQHMALCGNFDWA